MRDLLRQIQAALDRNLYYLALFASLAVPDICGAIASKDGISTPSKYKKWFDGYVSRKYFVGPARDASLTGEDCYRFRCSLLHQGSSQHPSSRYSRVIFVEPSANRNVFHNNVLEDALNLDVRIFCSDIVQGAEEWLQQHEATSVYKQNYGRFMSRYPEGLPPYIVGMPVIS